MAVSPEIISQLLPVLQPHEGCVLHAYQDSAGVWTIGWGHTGPEVHEGLVWTQSQADSQLVCDVEGHYSEILAVYAAMQSLSPSRQAALLDFVYNEGIGHFRSSTLLRRLQSGLYDDVPTELMKWDLAGGRVLEGLALRRQAECELWNQG